MPTNLQRDPNMLLSCPRAAPPNPLPAVIPPPKLFLRKFFFDSLHILSRLGSRNSFCQYPSCLLLNACYDELFVYILSAINLRSSHWSLKYSCLLYLVLLTLCF